VPDDSFVNDLTPSIEQVVLARNQQETASRLNRWRANPAQRDRGRLPFEVCDRLWKSCRLQAILDDQAADSGTMRAFGFHDSGRIPDVSRDDRFLVSHPTGNACGATTEGPWSGLMLYLRYATRDARTDRRFFPSAK
jgi:hypothetical protein